MGDRLIITIECSIPDEYLDGSYDNIPKVVQEKIEKMGGLPCDGGGRAGTWCKKCHWGSLEEEYE